MIAAQNNGLSDGRLRNVSGKKNQLARAMQGASRTKRKNRIRISDRVSEGSEETDCLLRVESHAVAAPAHNRIKSTPGRCRTRIKSGPPAKIRMNSVARWNRTPGEILFSVSAPVIVHYPIRQSRNGQSAWGKTVVRHHSGVYTLHSITEHDHEALTEKMSHTPQQVRIPNIHQV